MAKHALEENFGHSGARAKKPRKLGRKKPTRKRTGRRARRA